MAIDKIDELNQLKEKIEQGGGKDNIAKQHKENKMTARERMMLLFDEGSFVEIDAFIKHRSIEFDMPSLKAAAEGVVIGYGTVDGRPVYAYAQDYTVVKGSVGEMHSKKICKIIDMAMKTGSPLVSFIDSAGARLQEGIDALSGYGEIFLKSTAASGVIPQIAVIAGPCAGTAAFLPSFADFVFTIEKTTQLFVTGPQVVSNLTGKTITAEELGGAMTHSTKTGIANFINANEQDAIVEVRRLISFLPSNNLEMPVFEVCSDDLNRTDKELNELIADDKTIYDMHIVISAVVDSGDFMEVSPHYGASVITGFARLNGQTVGIVANQPSVMDGRLDSNSTAKAAGFIRICDAFNIPLVNLADTPGFVMEEEISGLSKSGGKMMYAYGEATVPKITAVIGKAYGGGYVAMCPKSLGADMVFAWPGAVLSVMEPEGASGILYSEDIKKAEDPVAMREEKTRLYKDTVASAYVAAQKGCVDDIIEPAMTRPMLIQALEMLSSKREQRPAKKHGTFSM